MAESAITYRPQLVRKCMDELRRPALKRHIGRHGDFRGFWILIERVPDDFDLDSIEFPMPIKCSTCRFLVPEFNEKMPCWNCVGAYGLPKWRPKQ